MFNLLGALRSASTGALIAYLFDPSEGQSRRSAIRRNSLDLVATVERETQRGWADLSERSKALIADLKSHIAGDREAESQLASKACDRLGHFISRPDLVDVNVHGTRAKLTGKVLTTEANSAVAAVMAVPGVTAVDQRLEVHNSVAELSNEANGESQGKNTPLTDIPAIRLLIGATGLLLAARVLGPRKTLGLIAASTAGIHLLRKTEDLDVPGHCAFEADGCEEPEPVDTALDDSFPASDPPSFTATAATRSVEPGETTNGA